MKPKLIYGLTAIAAIVILCGFKYSHRDGNDISGKQQIEILYFHGHSYVCYRFCEYDYVGHGGYGYGGASIVHDPDCKCGKESEIRPILQALQGNIP